MGKAALERDWNVLTYEGPGQASLCRYQHLGFIVEWENVVSPLVDYLHTFECVDTSAIALVDLSFGGLLAPRVLASKHRLAATIALDGLYEFGGLVLQSLPAVLQIPFNASNSTHFDDLINEYKKSPQAGTEFTWFVDQGLWAFNTTSPLDDSYPGIHAGRCH